ncbi:hypothetical protein MSPP1_003656 [Malassezia sp. CBS 17886]|nr:hypothetical protein MSPP1_003656 [Malassezia sp. CBS 17886]
MSCGHEHGHAHGHAHDDADHIRPGEVGGAWTLSQTQGQQDMLYASIDRDHVTALNERDAVCRRGHGAHRQGMAAGIIKPYDERLDETRYLESDVDDELIVHVPFAGSVQLRALMLKSGPAGATPRAVHVYKNLESLDFDDAARGAPPPAQKLESIPETREVVELPLLAARFPDVQSVTLYIPGCVSSGEAHTRIYFVGFRGAPKTAQRSGPQTLVYEAAPRATDHAKVPGTHSGAHAFQGR